ncbi:MAG: efflux RND transporter permease subunit [Candidatus Omnitrophica bacterium]|nr:efflux RND transporter permease subunit [Candidatus Omnitrophota bacterium]
MSLPRFSINQSLFVNLVSAVLIIFGLAAAFNMNKEIFPNVSFDQVSVTTAYPGAPPLDVEKLITVPIEKEIKEVDGIKEINSSSLLGLSYIQIKIDPDASDKQKVVNDIKDAVDKAKDLPKDIYEDPVVKEWDSKLYGIIEVSLSGEMSEKKLRHYADALEDMLEDIEGVARADKEGYRDREMQVHLDPEKMRNYYVSFDEVEEALASRNISIPAGEFNTKEAEYSVRTTGEFQTAEEVENIIIRANDAGNWLRIKDVADVEDSYKKEDIIYRTWGTRSINLAVVKKESGDAMDIVEDIKKTCNKFLENTPDPLNISYVNDYSFFAKRRLNVLRNNGWGSLIIVVFIMMLFLQKRVAFWTILGIPIAFLVTFIIMSIMGITINLISMFGLIIVLGMLVDDGIIVAENSYRYMEEGMPPRQAAVKGAEEVMGPITTAVITTIAAFSPLLFMTGIIGKFIRNIPTVVIIALLASLGEALIILPSHLADFVKIKLGSDGKPIGASKDLPWFKRLVAFYTKVVEKAIRNKWKVFFSVSATMMVSIILIILAFIGKGPLKFIIFPSAGINYFFVRAEAPIGTPLQRTNELIAPVEEIVSQIPQGEMDAFVTSVGKIQEDRHDPFAGQASNLAQIAVYLKPEQDRQKTVDEIIAEVRERTKDIKGFIDLRFDKPESGPPVGKAVEARIRGEDFDTLDKISFEYMDYLKAIDGTADIAWDHKPGKEEIRIKVDNEKAQAAGLSVAQVAKTVRGVFEGAIATKIKPVKAEEETDVTVMFPKSSASDINVFKNILVRNRTGKLILLEKIATIEKVPGTTTINHLNGKRVVTASCNVDTEKITSLEINKLLQKKFKDLSDRYIGYSVKYGGEQEETLDSMMSLLKAFLCAMLIIYLVLASFFKSLIQPLVVMLAIPFGLIGVVFAFLVHFMPFSFMSIMGMIGLSGIVVNDSIVLVDFINRLRREGMNRYDSIIKAGQMRLRPVILTTVTTAGGLSTVAYGIGGKDPFLVPMALSIAWGLIFATALTLVVIPCIYSIIDDIALKITHHSSMIRTAKVENNK